MESLIAKLFATLDEIVNENGMTWREKLAAIREQADEDDQTNLDEFLSWFEKPQTETQSNED